MSNSIRSKSINRREALRGLANGFGTFGLASLLGANAAQAGPLTPRAPHFPGTAKRVIFLFMTGGFSHIDSFDPKPALAKFDGQPSPGGNPQTERKTGNLMASPFAFQPRGQSGAEVSELFPEIGKRIDEFAVIRSLHTDIPNHPPAMLMMNCGRNVVGSPSMGSWLTYGLGSENQNLPGFVVLCPGKPSAPGQLLWSNGYLPGAFQGVQVRNTADALAPDELIPFLHNPRLDPAQQQQQLELLRQANQQHLADRPGDPELETSIEAMEVAYRMQSEATDAFDLSQESERTRERYGTWNFARGCLLARRLVERGVRVVQVFFDNGQPWDHHADIFMHQKLAPHADQATAALLDDLKERGLLDDTIVVFAGEFGRTPTAEISVRQFLQNGRDHNPYGFTALVAGGGFKGGQIYGSTDELGWHAVENRMHVHDLHATMLHALGFDHTKLTYRYSGRDFRLTDVEGRVVRELLA